MHRVPPETIAVAMSGGVDSSTVAAMLRAEGYNVVGLTMQLWNQRRLAGREGMPEHVQGRCCSIEDVYDARAVAEDLGIPYYVVNHQDRFERDVVRPFVQEYLSGRTPIPCSLCNNHLKFDQLLITARQIGADLLATGHYARCEFCAARNRWLLRRAADPAKDQTYFLFGLTQEQLSRTRFPLGEMSKPQVRQLARQHGLALAEKPDSQEICFVPGGDYKRFIDAYLDEQGEALPDTSGELVTSDGRVLGRHDGIHKFTVGQRKGLGVATGTPLYVININGERGQVTVGSNDELLSRKLIARNPNWIAFDDLNEEIARGARSSSAAHSHSRVAQPPSAVHGLRVQAKIRHRHEPAPATLEPLPNGEVLVTFDDPQRAITPGQAVVFYDGDLVLGGGWIAEVPR
ncbi:MAG TPA: tRNA 2-thiouridine(34) synthase MnmA [Candidatus Angelobacter sp.]|nr:tRNA 2-thiouridine(34) synthase MnmA [Candidatus Angelobacter sp.]